MLFLLLDFDRVLDSTLPLIPARGFNPVPSYSVQLSQEEFLNKCGPFLSFLRNSPSRLAGSPLAFCFTAGPTVGPQVWTDCPKNHSTGKLTQMPLTGLTAPLPSLFSFAEPSLLLSSSHSVAPRWLPTGSLKPSWVPLALNTSPLPYTEMDRTQACVPGFSWFLPSLVPLSGFQHFPYGLGIGNSSISCPNKTARSPPASGESLSWRFDPAPLLGLSLPFLLSFLDGALGVVPILPGTS